MRKHARSRRARDVGVKSIFIHTPVGRTLKNTDVCQRGSVTTLFAARFARKSISLEEAAHKNTLCACMYRNENVMTIAAVIIVMSFF